MRLRGARIERECATVALHGLIEPAQRLQYVAPIDERREKVSLHAQRLVIALEGFREPALDIENVTEVGGMIRSRGNNTSVRGGCFVELAQFLKNDAQVVERIRCIGIDGKRLTEGAGGLL